MYFFPAESQKCSAQPRKETPLSGSHCTAIIPLSQPLLPHLPLFSPITTLSAVPKKVPGRRRIAGRKVRAGQICQRGQMIGWDWHCASNHAVCPPPPLLPLSNDRREDGDGKHTSTPLSLTHALSHVHARTPEPTAAVQPSKSVPFMLHCRHSASVGR